MYLNFDNFLSSLNPYWTVIGSLSEAGSSPKDLKFKYFQQHKQRYQTHKLDKKFLDRVTTLKEVFEVRFSTRIMHVNFKIMYKAPVHATEVTYESRGFILRFLIGYLKEASS